MLSHSFHPEHTPQTIDLAIMCSTYVVYSSEMVTLTKRNNITDESGALLNCNTSVHVSFAFVVDINKVTFVEETTVIITVTITLQSKKRSNINPRGIRTFSTFSHYIDTVFLDINRTFSDFFTFIFSKNLIFFNSSFTSNKSLLYEFYSVNEAENKKQKKLFLI